MSNFNKLTIILKLRSHPEFLRTLKHNSRPISSILEVHIGNNKFIPVYHNNPPINFARYKIDIDYCSKRCNN